MSEVDNFASDNLVNNKESGVKISLPLFLVVLIALALFLILLYVYIKSSTKEQNFNRREDKTKIPVLQKEESKKEDLTSAEVLENIDERVHNPEETFSFNNGGLILFSIGPAYKFKMISKNEFEPGIIETVWQFSVAGQNRSFKVLSTRCSLVRDSNGEKTILGQVNVDEDAVVTPQFTGVDKPVTEEVFTDENSTNCYKVWGKLNNYEGLKQELWDFFALGKVSNSWTENRDGIVDLTDKLTLTLAGQYEN